MNLAVIGCWFIVVSSKQNQTLDFHRTVLDQFILSIDCDVKTVFKLPLQRKDGICVMAHSFTVYSSTPYKQWLWLLLLNISFSNVLFTKE